MAETVWFKPDFELFSKRVNAKGVHRAAYLVFAPLLVVRMAARPPLQPEARLESDRRFLPGNLSRSGAHERVAGFAPAVACVTP